MSCRGSEYLIPSLHLNMRLLSPTPMFTDKTHYRGYGKRALQTMALPEPPGGPHELPYPTMAPNNSLVITRVTVHVPLVPHATIPPPTSGRSSTRRMRYTCRACCLTVHLHTIAGEVACDVLTYRARQ